MKHKRRIVPVLMVAGILLYSCNNKRAKDSQINEIQKVSIVHASKEVVENQIISTGLITSSQEITLSFKNPGIVSKVLVNEGDFVRKGQLLVRMSSPEIESQYQQLGLKATEQERDLNRLKKLLRDTIVTLQQVQQTQTALESVKSQQTALRSNLESMNLYAPESGIILKRNVNEGEFKNASAPAILLGSNEQNINWTFRFAVTDHERLKLQIGQTVKITLDAAPDNVVLGKLFKMSNIPNPATGTYDCYASMDAKDNTLIYGLTGKAAIESYNPKAYSKIPLSTLSDIEGSSASIYWIDNKQVAHKKQVNIITIQIQYAFISDELPSDMNIVNDGKNSIRAGVSVTITSNK